MAKKVYVMVWRVIKNERKGAFVEHKFHDRVIGVYDSLSEAIKAKEEAGLLDYRHCDGHGVVIKTMTLDKLYLTPGVKADNERTKERIRVAKELDKKVAEYCNNDVIATKAVLEATQLEKESTKEGT